MKIPKKIIENSLIKHTQKKTNANKNNGFDSLPEKGINFGKKRKWGVLDFDLENCNNNRKS